MAGLFDEVLNNVGKEYKGGKGFEAGTHEVTIGTAEAKDSKGRAIIEVVVSGVEDEDKTATCTLWFHTEGAAKMSVTKVLGMLVHKVPEDKKDAVRDLGRKLFGDIEDLTKARDIAAKLMNDKLIGERAFLIAEPNGNYKTTSYGDLWHYAAESKKSNTDMTQAGDVALDDLPPFDTVGDDL